MKRPKKLLLLLFTVVSLLLPGCDNRTPVGGVNSGDWSSEITFPRLRFTPADQLEIIVWHDYIPQEIFDLFYKKYGVKIVPTFIESNQEAFNLLQQNPGKHDIIIVSDYMVTQMIRGRHLHKLNHDNIKNIRFLNEDVLRTPYDRGLIYTIPLFRACVGITFNMHYIPGIPRTWDFVVKNIKNDYLNFRTGIRKEKRIALGLALIFLGYSPNTTNPEEITRARDLLIEVISKHGTALVGAESRDKMINNALLLGLNWNGNAAYALTKNPNIRFLLPEGKVLISYDNITINARSKHIRTAEFFVNYLLIPEVSAKMTNFNYFANTNIASLPFIRPIIRNGPGFLFPSEAHRLLIKDLGEKNNLYTDAWAMVLQAKPSKALIKLPLPERGIYMGAHE